MYVYIQLAICWLVPQTPTSSRFACKYARLEVFAGLRKLHSNEAIRGIILGIKKGDVIDMKKRIMSLLLVFGYVF